MLGTLHFSQIINAMVVIMQYSTASTQYFKEGYE